MPLKQTLKLGKFVNKHSTTKRQSILKIPKCRISNMPGISPYSRKTIQSYFTILKY